MSEAATSTSGALATPSAPGPAATGSTPVGGTPTTNDVNPGAWMAGFSDDLKGRVGTKGFKGPADLADAYFNLEKLQGVPQDRLMKLPEKFYDDKGALTTDGRQIYERLGTPKEAKGYELEKLLPKEGGDKALMEHFQGIFHEAGVPKDAASKIVTKWNEYQAQQSNTVREQTVQRFKDSDGQLHKDWGAAYDQNRLIARDGMTRLGHDAKTVDALAAILGHDKTMKLYHQLGSAVGESAFHGGKPPAILEPNSAKSKIDAYKQDSEFMKKVFSGDAQAKETWTNLHKQAYPGEINFR